MALQPFAAQLPRDPAPLLMIEPAPDGPGYIARALERCAESGASDLLLHVGSVPHVRIDGSLQRWTTQADQAPLAAELLERVLAEVLDQAQLLQLSVDGELRCVYQTPDKTLRARVHAYSSELGLNAAFRLLPREVPSAESLGLSAALRSLRDFPRGLCICSGPSGSGKTTTLAAIAQHLATQRALHVVSLESPLELQASGGLGLFEQREIGRHVGGYVEGIEWAVGQAADVIVVADLLVPGALAASLHASRAGCLVLAGVRATSSQKALANILAAQSQLAMDRVRMEVAHTLRLLLHQRLVPKADGRGRVAAFEQIVYTPQFAQLIRDDQLQQLPAMLAASKSAGMVSLDDALDELTRAGGVTAAASAAAARKGAHFRGV
jgi:twitching motility protein PilT